MSTSDDRRKFPRSLVLEVFEELRQAFEPSAALTYAPPAKPKHTPFALADRLCAVGGLRRQKREMKDLEFLYIPRIAEEEDPGDLFGAKRQVNVSERVLDGLLASGVLAKRPSVTGVCTWGTSNKLAIHTRTGLPVDIFAATPENYFNRMVVTTGPKELNVLIASKAHDIGFDWKVAEAGFVPRGTEWEGNSKRVSMRSEREVFGFVNVEFLPPCERGRIR